MKTKEPVMVEVFGTEPTVSDIARKLSKPLHAKNLTVIQRIAAARNYRLETGEAVDGWVPVRLTWQGSAKPNLSIVERVTP